MLASGSNWYCHRRHHGNNADDNGHYQSSNNSNVQQRQRRRIRRDWDTYTENEKELYYDAIETAIERGYHQRFVQYHADNLSNQQAHATCSFFLWHRYFLLGYENMLRSLQTRFACITIPYWNLMDGYHKQQNPNDDACHSYSTCSPLVNDMGGLVDNDDFHDRTYEGYTVDGHLYDKTPIQNLFDDLYRQGIIRYDMWFDPIPSSVSTNFITDTILKDGVGKDGTNYLKFWSTLQTTLHDNVHDTVGGFMRRPSSSIDPLFMPLHATIDMIGYLWENCNLQPLSLQDKDNDDKYLSYLTRSRTSTTTVTSTAQCTPVDWLQEEMIMKRVVRRTSGNMTQYLDIRNDDLIGKYFNETGIGMNFTKIARIDQFNEDYSYTYDVKHLDLYRTIIASSSGKTNKTTMEENLSSSATTSTSSSSTMCPHASSFANRVTNENDNGGRDAEAVIVVPKFTSDEIRSTYHPIWYQQAREYYANTTTTQDSQQQQQDLCYVQCILNVMDHDTLERWIIDPMTVFEQVIQSHNIYHPDCSKYQNHNYNHHPNNGTASTARMTTTTRAITTEEVMHEGAFSCPHHEDAKNNTNNNTIINNNNDDGNWMTGSNKHTSSTSVAPSSAAATPIRHIDYSFYWTFPIVYISWLIQHMSFGKR